MSFQFMPLYTGDYVRDTRHLSPLRNGVYIALLMHSWDQRGPVPLEEQECAGIANCRSSDEIEALRYVLGKYFVRMDDGYYNERMQKEIEKAFAISKARSVAGIKGYQAKAKQLLSKSLASATTPTTTTTTTKEKTKEKDSRLTAPVDVSEKVWKDWLIVRKEKNLAVTGIAIEGIRREAKKAGLSLEAALVRCCEEGWAGFKAKWLEKDLATAAEPWKGAVNL